MNNEPEIVWLTEERIYAELINLGSFYSMVKYTRGGLEYEVIVDNDDFEYWSEREIDTDNE